MAAESSISTAKRNRMIAIAAGAITVVAIVLAFASEYLELPWKWIRPAAELLLLGELVGLVVLERHQLFEPVNVTVQTIDRRVALIHDALTTNDLAEISGVLARIEASLKAGGQVTVTVGTRETLAARNRLMREALQRDQKEPQTLRFSLLTGQVFLQDLREGGEELQLFERIVEEFALSTDIPADSKAHRWTIRGLFA